MKRLLRSTLLTACFAACALCPTLGTKAADFLIIVDSSGSMSEPTLDGQTKMEAAKAALRELKGDLSAHQLGMTLFGHRMDPKMPGSCQDVETVMPIADFVEAEYDRVVNSLTPRGNTPLAEALRKATAELMFREKSTNKIVIVVTDGNETCGGDPIAIAGQMLKLGINIKVHVIGLGVQPQEQQQLRALAEAGEGQFGLANTRSDLETLMRERIQPVAVLTSTAKVDEPKLSIIERALVKKLQDENRDVRQSAAKTLAKMKASNTIFHLSERLAVDEDYYAWHAAAAALQALEMDGFDSLLIDVLGVKQPDLRLWAAQLLAKLDTSTASDPSAIDAALIEALHDGNRDVRKTVANSLLARKATAAVPELRKRLMVDEDYYAWHAAIAALNGLAEDQAVEAIVSSLDAESSEIRTWATAWASNIK